MGVAEDIDDLRCPNCGSFDIEVNLFEGTFCNNCGSEITQKDIVEDYYTVKHPNGISERLLVSSIHCPKPPPDYSLFDPRTDDAKAALKKYQKTFKNRRRYQRDRERRYGTDKSVV